MRRVVLFAVLVLTACGARTELLPGVGPARDSGLSEASDAVAPRDASADDAAPPPPDSAPACGDEPCLCAPPLAAGASVSGTTCDAVNPQGSTCSDTPTAFVSFVIPPQTELPLGLSSNLQWGVLCACPEVPGAGCCVGPGGNTGPYGISTFLANPGSTPLAGVLEVGRTDEPCGPYTITLGK